jgi:hypothetical protein
MTAEHVKWCSHLSGAKSLIAEIDYLSMSKEARRLKAEAAGHRAQHPHSDITLQREIYGQTEDEHHPIDENIVSAFFGKKLKYDQFGRIIDDLENGKRRNSLPELFDLGRFELYQDLFWWYAKQDCFQSIISGNPLLSVSPLIECVNFTNLYLVLITTDGQTALPEQASEEATRFTAPLTI